LNPRLELSKKRAQSPSVSPGRAIDHVLGALRSALAEGESVSYGGSLG
jgi:hypothetical protein